MTVIKVKEEAEKGKKHYNIDKKIQHFARCNHVMHITIMQ